MKRFLAFYTLIYLRSVETLYHVIIGFCWFHQGPSFSIRMHALLFFSLHPWSRRPLCTDGFKTHCLMGESYFKKRGCLTGNLTISTRFSQRNRLNNSGSLRGTALQRGPGAGPWTQRSVQNSLARGDREGLREKKRNIAMHGPLPLPKNHEIVRLISAPSYRVVQKHYAY